MKEHVENKRHFFLPVRMISILVIMLFIIVVATSAFKAKSDSRDTSNGVVNKDSIESVDAFKQVYSVLMSPRCMNCHPKGEVPLQGDDSHPHTMGPKRGKDGHGLYAMKCANCHQPENTAGLHTPPGNPKWALPPADMKMVFEGKKPHELALQIMDYNKNGHKNREQLLDHARDTLVKAGWNMGNGRVPPPLPYNDFVKAWDTWIKKGAFAPGGR